MTQHIVTVVVPTFRRPEALHSCLEALAAQTLRVSWEVVIVDDGSPDPLTGIQDKFSNRINLRIVRQENAGPAAARNRGVAEARGKFVAFTDDDCRPEATWLETMLAAALNNPEALIGGTTYNGVMHNHFSSVSQLIVDLVYEHFNADPARGYFLASNNLLCSRKAFLEVQGFAPEFARAGAEDRDFCDRWRQAQLPIIWCKTARVEHRHAQTLIQFVELHFRYGRGAFLYQQMRRNRKSGTIGEDLGFHRSLPARVLSLLTRQQNYGTKIATVTTLMLWQIANAIGFVFAAIRSWLRSVHQS